MELAAAKAKTAWLPDAFFPALAAAADQIGASAADLLLVLYAESGLRASAAFRDGAYPTAVGLNQITKVRAAAMGMTEAERVGLLRLSELEQLPYVVRSFKSSYRGAYVNAPMLYLVNFTPAHVAHAGDPDFVLYDRASSPKTYAANATLDTDHDGRITVGNLGTWLRSRAQEPVAQAALVRLRAALASPELVARYGDRWGSSPSSSRGFAAVGLLLAAAAVAGAWMWWHR